MLQEEPHGGTRLHGITGNHQPRNTIPDHVRLQYEMSPLPSLAMTVLKLSIRFSMLRFNVSLVVQGDSGRKLNILVGDRIGHCGKRSWYEPVSHSVRLYVHTVLFRFCLWCWVKSGIYWRKVGTGDELLARIFYAAACIKESEDQPERTRDIRTRVAKCIVVVGSTFEHLLWTIMNLSFLSNRFVI
jgi:hypothetical protein